MQSIARGCVAFESSEGRVLASRNPCFGIEFCDCELEFELVCSGRVGSSRVENTCTHSHSRLVATLDRGSNHVARPEAESRVASREARRKLLKLALATGSKKSACEWPASARYRDEQSRVAIVVSLLSYRSVAGV